MCGEMAEKKVETAKKTLDRGIDKITSPFEKTKKALKTSMEKAEAPFKALEAKRQQTKNATDAAKNKVESAKKLLNVKEMANREARSKMNKTFGDSIGKVKNAKKNVEDSQREFQKAGELVKLLTEKLEALGKRSVPGGKI